MDSEHANVERCRNRPGSYEAWYVTVNDPSTRRGFWIRYTTLQTDRAAAAPPHAALWAFGFDHDDPSLNWAGRQVFPLAALESTSRPFTLRLGDAVLGPDGCAGSLMGSRGVARWQLSWRPRDEAAFPFLNPRFEGLSSVSNIGARPSLAVSGTIELGGRAHTLVDANGGQQHTWGSSHALSWNWGFASGPDFWVDGVTSRVRSRLGRVLAATLVGAQVHQETFRCNGILDALRNPGSVAAEGWTARAQLGPRRLEVDIRPRRQDLIGVTYTDPRGGSRYCYHSEVADLRLVLSGPGGTVAEVQRPACAAFEYASGVPLEGVPLAI